MQFYNSATTKLKERLYLMFRSGLLTRDETVSVYAAYSRDGEQFLRLGHTPLSGLGQGFDSKGIYVCPGAIPGEEPNTYWIYYGATGMRHDATPGSHRYNGGLGRFLLKVVE